MTDVDQTAGATGALESLNERITKEAAGNWVHSNFSVAADGEIACADSYAYRRKLLEALFSSLFVERSVLVMDEIAGFYPALIHRAGAREVAAATTSQARRELIGDVLAELSTPATVLKSRVLAFYEAEPYVDGELAERYEFLLALNQIWPLYNAAGGSFDAIAEATAFMVTDGVVFDWTHAEWAKPPPPPEYGIHAFTHALRKKFAHVVCIADQLIIAVNKLQPRVTGAVTNDSLEGTEPGVADESRDRELAAPAVNPGDLVALRDDLHRRQPSWVTRSLSWNSTLFLMQNLVASGEGRAVEIGAASGFSAAAMASCLHLAVEAGVRDTFAIESFDLHEYAESDHRIGDAAFELVPDLMNQITFHTHRTSVDVASHFAPDSVGFIFIDADHGHPWPTLDLLLSLPVLRPGAWVVMDDINLPLSYADNSDWGAHHLFYGICGAKMMSRVERDRLPAMGSFRVPADKEAFRAELVSVLDEHPWQRDIPQDVVRRARNAGDSWRNV